MKKVAFLPAAGIGDALLMMIAAHHFSRAGYSTEIYHPRLAELSEWFPGHSFISSRVLPYNLSSYDSIFIQNDNHPFIKDLKEKHSNVGVFYPTYKREKHGDLSERDHIFHADKSMATNFAEALTQIFPHLTISKDNGICLPEKLAIPCAKREGIAIHPTSRDPKKNWALISFARLALQLQHAGYAPFFVAADSETPCIASGMKGMGIPIRSCSCLSELATVLCKTKLFIGNDSGPGHLASNLGIKTVIIASDAMHMNLWRPDWEPSVVITPSKWIPNWKGMRLRQRYWSRFLSPGHILRQLRRAQLLF